MAQAADTPSGLLKLGTAVATAFSLLVASDAYIDTQPRATKPAHENSARLFVEALHEIKASAAEINQILDKVLLKLLNERDTVRSLNLSTFITLGDGLRSLEQHIRQSEDFKGEPGQRREFLKALASIRSRVTDITSIALQSRPPSSTFDSTIDRTGLATLAENGTRYASKLAG